MFVIVVNVFIISSITSDMVDISPAHHIGTPCCGCTCGRSCGRSEAKHCMFYYEEFAGLAETRLAQSALSYIKLALNFIQQTENITTVPQIEPF